MRVPEVECRARYFPAPAPGDDTVFYDVTQAAADLDLTWWQAQDHPGPGPRYLASWGE